MKWRFPNRCSCLLNALNVGLNSNVSYVIYAKCYIIYILRANAFKNAKRIYI